MSSLDYIWNTISFVISDQLSIFLTYKLTSKMMVDDKYIQYFDQKKIEIFADMKKHFSKKYRINEDDPIYDSPTLFSYKLKDNYKVIDLPLECILYIAELSNNSGNKYVQKDHIKYAYKDAKEIQKMEDIIMNLILVNNEYKRQI